jgi:hypothetical protein
MKVDRIRDLLIGQKIEVIIDGRCLDIEVRMIDTWKLLVGGTHKDNYYEFPARKIVSF